MENKHQPYRHELKSKLKTQVVKNKSKYNKVRQKEYIIEMMRDAEKLGLYDDN